MTGYMRDSFGREIEYLRISVTQCCNLKCIYCMPNEQACGDNVNTVLSPKEIELVAGAMAELGIKKVRLTGGEPLLRKDICEIVENISKIKGIEEISLTTNGILLERYAKSLKAAGLCRLNISLDSLNESTFEQITGYNGLKAVLTGIDEAVRVGLAPIRVNTVLIKGINDNEAKNFIELTRDKQIDVRFIELMPIGIYGENNSDKMVPNNEIIKANPLLLRYGEGDEGNPAIYYKINGYKGRVGFISPISHKFCGSCNRVRLTSDGKLRLCLGQNSEISILKTLRNKPNELVRELQNIIYQKPKGHSFEKSFSSKRSMNKIGG